MTHYEIIIICDREYGEVICYATNEIMNDSNDIVSYAIKNGLLEDKCRKCVRWARAIPKCEHIEKMKYMSKNNI